MAMKNLLRAAAFLALAAPLSTPALAGESRPAKDEAPPDTAVPMTVKCVARNNLTGDFLVILENPAKDRFLDIYIGPAEAISIAQGLRDGPPERPMTHDILMEMVERMGGKVVRVAVTEVRENTFFGEITVLQGETKLVFDARPSDSIALSLRAKSPIYVEKKVLEESGHERDYSEEAEEDGEEGAPANEGAEEKEGEEPGEKAAPEEKKSGAPPAGPERKTPPEGKPKPGGKKAPVEDVETGDEGVM